jgi:hypothetical protein
MSKTRSRHPQIILKEHRTVDPIKRDRILIKLMREYSERKISLEQIKQRDPQSSRNTENINLFKLLLKSNS